MARTYYQGTMTDQYTKMDVIELGKHAGEHPDDEDAAAELMKRALESNPRIKGIERRWGNEIVFIQPENGPSLSDFGEDYDYNLEHIVTIGKNIEKLPSYDKEDGKIVVKLCVCGIREDYVGRARPDYSQNGARYKGDGPEPKPGLQYDTESDEPLSPVKIEMVSDNYSPYGEYLGIIDRIVDGEYVVFQLIDGTSDDDGDVVGDVIVNVEEIPNEGRYEGARFRISIDDGGELLIEHLSSDEL